MDLYTTNDSDCEPSEEEDSVDDDLKNGDSDNENSEKYCLQQDKDEIKIEQQLIQIGWDSDSDSEWATLSSWVEN